MIETPSASQRRLDGTPRRRAGTPTLVVFTLGDERDSLRQPLLPASHRALERELRRSCLDAAVEAGRECGCQLVVCTPDDASPVAGATLARQRGNSFGQRLRGALKQAFADGDGPVLLVGGDVPGLRAEHIRQALDRLAARPEEIVVGPSPDGGLYLLAAAEPFDEALARVRWCRSDTLESLRRSLRRDGRRINLLPALIDLDQPRDLEIWLSGRSLTTTARRWQQLCGVLLALLARWRRPHERFDTQARSFDLTSPYLGRAPPVLCH